MSKDKDKPKTESGTPAGTGKSTGGVDFAELLAKAATIGGTVPKGPLFTTQDANAYVQGIYQQLLGRNAVGAERTKGINVFLNQPRDTDAGGRQQAVMAMAMQTPEYRRRQENRYLDAIYNEIAQEVREAQA